ncbi:MAG: acyltransferase [Oscillospiraceae bacterium]|jgi:peptidoglycan/LPS O-acetylase OafA/YrhL|nr:acyltransferase [Oscillospiraceae bacterium]
MSNIKTARNTSVDFLRLICAFLIVALHCLGLSNGMVSYSFLLPLTRFAVPVFFIITGYFYNITAKKQTEKRQIFKILKLVIITNALFLVWGIVFRVFSGSLNVFLFDILLKPQTITDFLLFNYAVDGQEHLWYLSALLYILVIAYVFPIILKNKCVAIALVVFLLAVNITFAEFGNMLQLPFAFKSIYVRNFLFTGLPFFLIGNLLFRFKGTGFYKKLNLPILIALLVLSFIGTFAESYFINNKPELFISSIASAVAIFLIFSKIQMPQNKLSVWGQKYSLSIYLFHMVVIQIYSFAARKFALGILFFDIEPIIVFAVCLIAAFVYYNCKDKLKLRLNTNKNSLA